MTDNTKGEKTGFTGELTAEEIEADRKANAEQDTRPSITVERATHALRTGKHRK